MKINKCENCRRLEKEIDEWKLRLRHSIEDYDIVKRELEEIKGNED